ncbi:MAG: hypothetical protein PHO27_12225 [Sulfuricurvum sp.]|nr:hypothetical protein [Sulfuricurvum sp.]
MINLFLDSGAFSAKSKGVEIDIGEYIKFIKENKKYITVYANLDVIGDAEAGWKNQKIMEDAGLSPLPVYHIEDDISYLYRCLEYPYFCLGGMATGYTTAQRRSFLDMCFEIICNTIDGMPKCKIHGFGMTSLELLLRYPWYSVDSTSWVLTGRFGSVFVPRKVNGSYVYDESSWKVTVSNQSPDQIEEGKHFNTFAPMEQNMILQYLKEKGFKIGKSEYKEENRKTYKLQDGERWVNSADAPAVREMIEEFHIYAPNKLLAMRDMVEIVIEPGLSNDYKQRDELNIIYFMDLERSLPSWPWAWKRTSLSGFGFRP